MNILLTGGTGYLGSAVLRELIANNHAVTAAVRSEDAATTVKAAGATAVVGDITDADWLGAELDKVDAAIHTASPGDASSPDFDGAVVDAVLKAFSGTGKTYVHTGGVWVWGSAAEITESDPFDAPAITAWRAGVESAVLGADFPSTVIAPGVVYGYGRGIPSMLTGGPRDEQGRLVLIGTGDQHWATVHTDDLGRLYVTVLERGESLGYVLGVNGESATVRELGEAFAGEAGVVPDTLDGTRGRLGAPFADALFLDQQASAAKARGLGWNPTGPSLLDELRDGYGA